MFSYLLRIVVSLIINFGVCQLITASEFLAQSLFTVLGIFYSIQISNVINFNYEKVINSQYRKIFRERIDALKKWHTFEFATATFFYVISMTTDIVLPLNFDLLTFTSILMLFFGMSYVKRFFALHKLQQDLDDRIFNEQHPHT